MFIVRWVGNSRGEVVIYRIWYNVGRFMNILYYLCFIFWDNIIDIIELEVEIGKMI